MNATLPLPIDSAFPSVRRARVECLQVNVGYRCNQSCRHCHVNAGPKRTEAMDRETAQWAIRYLQASAADTLDITGGAPELNPNFRYLVKEARKLGRRVIDRCNLTILVEPGHEDLAVFLAEQEVEVMASLPCYLRENVDRQRGRGVFDASIEGLKRLNAAGYGNRESGLVVDLVYNPLGPILPPPQAALEAEYARELAERYGVRFNRLLTLANIPIGRFGSALVSKGQFQSYMSLLRGSHRSANLQSVMCRTLVNVDWQGYVYDCDFNQMINLPMRHNGSHRVHLSELVGKRIEGQEVVVMDHCYGCTAGQGSSCGGALS